MVEGYFEHSMMRKAQEQNLLKLEIVNLRDFGLGPRKTVDDTPYGGGDGMVLRPEPVVDAIEHARTENSLVLLMSPQGKMFKQSKAQELSGQEHLIFVCGRYEGFDERIRNYIDEEISIGEYVLTGGELPAMVIADAAVRLIPGVLGGESSADIESYADGKTLEYPQYTKPDVFRGEAVPDVLKSGHHAEIKKWRNEQAQRKTNLRKK